MRPYVMSPIMRRALLTVNTGPENCLRVFHQTRIERPLQIVSADFQSLLKALAGAINKHDMNCKCQLSMERYKKNGIIGDDWHEWVAS